jgi:DGQHR domain-containing protein
MDSQMTMLPPDPDKQQVPVKVLVVKQPIGEMYVAAMPHKTIVKIAKFDVRRILRERRDVETYLGIQRPLDKRRVEELQKYVKFKDAAFPSSIIVAIDDDYVDFDEETSTLVIRNFREGDDQPSIALSDVAKVLDGQHRIAGLEALDDEAFEVPVSIFVGMDLADQAYVFSTVNLEQTKVSRSLAYDHFSLARTESPQKLGHKIAVRLDRDEKSPFYQRIKRLGVATPGRGREFITQATFVEAVLDLISRDPKADRDMILKGRKPLPYQGKDKERFVFRDFFLEDKNLELTAIIFNYFNAVRERWPVAWVTGEKGAVLSKTSGFRALMRFLRDIYLLEKPVGNTLTQGLFLEYFRKVEVDDSYFNTNNFKPGSSGESDMIRLFRSTLPEGYALL